MEVHQQVFAELIGKMAAPPLGPLIRALAIGVITGVLFGGLTAMLFPEARGVAALVAGITAGLSSSAHLGRT